MQFEFRVSCKSSKAAKPKQMQLISWSSHKFSVGNAERATEILIPEHPDGLH